MELRKTCREYSKGGILWVNKREVLVYISIFLYCVAFFLSRVRIPFSQSVIYKTMFLAAFIAMLNVLLDSTMTRKQIFLSAFMGVLLLLDAIPTRNYELITLFIIIWGCRNTEYDKIIKFILQIVAVMTVCIMFLALSGLMESNVHVTNGRTRYDFGYASWAILPFQYLSLAMIFLYLKKKKTRLRDIAFLFTLGLLICDLADVKSAKLLLMIALIGLFVCDYIKIKNWKKLKFLICVPELLALLSYVGARVYGAAESGLIRRINVFLNNRLMYAAIGLEEYGIHFLSNSDFKTVYESQGYFGIDNCYLYLLVAWGVIGLVVVLFIYSYIINYCIKTENLKLLFITLIMVLNAIMWNRLLILIEMEILICFSDIFKLEFYKKEIKDYKRIREW